MLKVWKKMAWYISLKHLLKFAGQKNYNCVTLKKKSQLCDKHNCEKNSCVVSMVCESMIHPLRLARGNYLRREIGERSENCVLFKVLEVPDYSTCAFQTNWRDKPEVPSEVFRTVLEKKVFPKFHIHTYRTFTIEQLKEHKKLKH